MNSFSENIFQTTHRSDSLFYVDHSLESKTSGTCDLIVLVEKHSVQLALKEKRSGRLLAVEIIPAGKNHSEWKPLLEITTTHSKLLRNYEFSRVTAGIMSTEYTLVPEALFKKGDQEAYYRKNFMTSPEQIIHAEFIIPFRLYSIFSIETELENELNHLFQDPKLWHFSQALLTGIGLQTKADSGKQLLLNVHGEYIDIVVTENKKLLLMNSYSWKTHEDILYFTLFIFEQLELSTDSTPLILTGETDADSPLYLILYKYIRKVIFPEKPSSLLNIFKEGGLSFHKYSSLYNFSLCE